MEEPLIEYACIEVENENSQLLVFRPPVVRDVAYAFVKAWLFDHAYDNCCDWGGHLMTKDDLEVVMTEGKKDSDGK